MHFNSWISNVNKKLLIVDNNDSFNKLVKNYCISTKNPVMNTKAITLEDISCNLLYASRGDKGFIIINDSISAAIIDRLLRLCEPDINGNLYGFIPETSIGLKTPYEVFKAIKQLRFGRIIHETSKVKHLLKLATDYDEFLKANNYYDQYRLYSDVLEFIYNNNNYDFKKVLGYGENLQIGILEPIYKKLTYLESQILNAILGVYNKKLDVLEYINKERNVCEKFVDAYGLFNEVSFLVKEIKNNKIPTGAVNVLYTADAYENIIRSLFEINGIKATYNSAHANSTNLIQLINDYIEFYRSDMLYEKLYSIVKNPIFKLNGGNAIKLYSAILRKGICVGKERYINYVKESTEDKYKPFNEFLLRLCEIDINMSPLEIYKGILSIVRDYIYINDEYIALAEKLKNLEIYFYIMDGLDRDLLNQLDYIQENINGITYSEPNDDLSVSVSKITGLTILDRAYTFVLGMSSSEIKIKEVESAIISDDEYEYILDKDYYFPLSRNSNADFENMLDNIFDSQNNGTIYFEYMSNDNVEFNPSAPSVYYLDRKGSKKEIRSEYDYDEVEYKINKEDIRKYVASYNDNHNDENLDNIKINDISDYTKDLNIIPESVKYEEEKQEDSFEWKFSATGLGTLVKCPMCYIYKYFMNLPDMDFKELNSYSWLDPLARGNLFHHTLEYYSNEAYNDGTNIPFNEEIFDASFKKALEEADDEIASPSDEVKYKEIENNKKMIVSYIKKLQAFYDENHNKGINYRNIGNELRFGPGEDIKINYPIDRSIIINDKEYNAKVAICLNGSIDRLDGYVIDNVLHFRIIDYKTSKKDNLSSEIKEYTKIQHYIYALAVKEYFNKKKEYLENAFSSRIESCVIDDMVYELVISGEELCWSDGFSSKDYPRDYSDINNIKIPDKVLDAISLAYQYKKGVNLDIAYRGISEYFIKYADGKKLSKLEPNKYSNYKHICRYEIDTFEGDEEDGEIN